MKTRRFTLLVMTGIAGMLSAAAVLAGCGNKVADSNTSSVENTKREETYTTYTAMEEIKKSVIEIVGENYWPDRRLTAEELNTYTGILAEDYEEFMAERISVETDIDEIIIVKAQSGKTAEIEKKLNVYRNKLIDQYQDRPQELGKAEASRIEIIGSYICFVQLGADTAAAAKSGEKAVLAVCQQENERAVDAIEKTIYEIK